MKAVPEAPSKKNRKGQESAKREHKVVNTNSITGDEFAEQAASDVQNSQQKAQKKQNLRTIIEESKSAAEQPRVEEESTSKMKKQNTNLKAPRAQNPRKSFMESTSRKSGRVNGLDEEEQSSFQLSKSNTVRESFRQGSTDELLYEKNIFFNQK